MSWRGLSTCAWRQRREGQARNYYTWTGTWIDSSDDGRPCEGGEGGRKGGREEGRRREGGGGGRKEWRGGREGGRKGEGWREREEENNEDRMKNYKHFLATFPLYDSVWLGVIIFRQKVLGTTKCVDPIQWSPSVSNRLRMSQETTTEWPLRLDVSKILLTSLH